MRIPLETIGKILAGEDQGKFVKVMPDREQSGGFFILTSEHLSFKSAFDNWVKDEADLNGFFLESRWLVEWQKSDSS
jgi:hypothetical protein